WRPRSNSVQTGVFARGSLGSQGVWHVSPVLMLDFPFQPQLAIAIAECPCKLRFQLANTSHLLPHIHKLALEHGLHFGTGVILCRNASSSLTSLSENPNSWVCRTNSRSRIRPPSNKRYPPALRPAVLVSPSL